MSTALPRALGPLAGLLDGLQVLDLSRNLPGPYATRMLADLGATIVKVEPPEGDPARPLAPLFEALNHGKECRTIDFRQPADLDRLRMGGPGRCDARQLPPGRAAGHGPAP